jgi:hypothetical protein
LARTCCGSRAHVCVVVFAGVFLGDVHDVVVAEIEDGWR